MQFLQTPGEQGRDHEEEQRERDLAGDQDPCRGSARGVASTTAGLRCECARETDVRAAQRRQQAEAHTTRERHDQGERRDLPIQIDIDAIGHRRTSSEPDAPMSDQESQAGAEHGQEQAFRQQLANESASPGADRDTNGDLTLASRRARDQQAGDVGARNRQEQDDHGEQDEQRSGHLGA